MWNRWTHATACFPSQDAPSLYSRPTSSLGVGSELVRRVVAGMAADGCQEVSLEAEVGNAGALRLYERLGFLRDKRLRR